MDNHTSEETLACWLQSVRTKHRSLRIPRRSTDAQTLPFQDLWAKRIVWRGCAPQVVVDLVRGRCHHHARSPCSRYASRTASRTARRKHLLLRNLHAPKRSSTTVPQRHGHSKLYPVIAKIGIQFCDLAEGPPKIICSQLLASSTLPNPPPGLPLKT